MLAKFNRSHFVLFLTLSAVGLLQIGCTRKFIAVSNDGFSIFTEMNVKTATKDPISAEKYLAESALKPFTLRGNQVGAIDFNVLSGGRTNYPSAYAEQIGDDWIRSNEAIPSLGRSLRKVDHLLQKVQTILNYYRAHKINVLKVIAEEGHRSGLEVFATIRMNDTYPENADWTNWNVGRFLNGSFFRNHPEFRIIYPIGTARWQNSFAFPKAHQFKLGIIKEVLQQPVDGIHLDFLRSALYFGYEAPMVEAFEQMYPGTDATKVGLYDPRWEAVRFPIMKLFFLSVRALVDEESQRRGKKIYLSLRFDHYYYRDYGLDVENWVRSGLLDGIVVDLNAAPRGAKPYVPDITNWVKIASGTGCKVLAGVNSVVHGKDYSATHSILRSHQDYEDAAVREYQAGGDGLYIFNESSIDPKRWQMFSGLWKNVE